MGLKETFPGASENISPSLYFFFLHPDVMTFSASLQQIQKFLLEAEKLLFITTRWQNFKENNIKNYRSSFYSQKSVAKVYVWVIHFFCTPAYYQFIKNQRV